jgi:TolA-binding protein
MKKTCLLILLLSACVASLHAETRIGSLKTVSGSVSIDAFGKGSFIPAVKGDDLYASTVITTGANGRATVELQGQTAEVPPGATVRIADLGAASAKKGGLKWFSAVGKLVKSFTEASRQKQGDLVLGSRAADASEEQSRGMDWEVEETDAAALLPDARKLIDEGSYAAALQKLVKADTPDDPGVAWQLSFWEGFCYFQLEDYPDAVTHLAAAYTRTNASHDASISAADRGMLLFQLGSSYYLLGREKDAVPVLEAFLSSTPDDRYAPYAALLLSKALAGSGNAARSRTIATAALQKYRGTDLEPELAALSK